MLACKKKRGWSVHELVGKGESCGICCELHLPLVSGSAVQRTVAP